ncbi:outer membrane protein assembly factor BamE [Marinobacteraceae bacterium S3BR75-40.1]
MQNTRLLSALLALAILLAGCAFPGVYRINVQQGNIVKQEDLDKLKPGMDRDDVHYVLGTPLVINPVDRSRDYYLYTFQDSGGPITDQRVIVYYEDDQYVRYTADLMADTPAY